MLGLSTGLIHGNYISGAGWLKGDVLEDQPGFGTVRISSSTSFLTSHTRSSGDYFVISFKIIVFDGGADLWDGQDAVRTRIKLTGSSDLFQDIEQDTLTTFTKTHTWGDSGGSELNNYFNGLGPRFDIKFRQNTDKPDAGAKVYVKDIDIKVYNSSNVLLDSYASNFTTSTDGFVGVDINGDEETEFVLSFNQTTPI